MMLLINLAASGCQWPQLPANPDPAVVVPLLNPVGPARRIVQSVNVDWQGQESQFLCVLELNQHRISIGAVNPQGISLFNLTYNGKQVSMTKSPLLPKNLPPEMIVKDIQLAYWPVAMLQQQFPDPLRLSADSKQRHLHHHHQLIAEVNFLQTDAAWPKTVELINHRFHYKLLINTLSYEAIPE